jgi:hypothetical protein
MRKQALPVMLGEGIFLLADGPLLLFVQIHAVPL